MSHLGESPLSLHAQSSTHTALFIYFYFLCSLVRLKRRNLIQLKCSFIRLVSGASPGLTFSPISSEYLQRNQCPSIHHRVSSRCTFSSACPIASSHFDRARRRRREEATNDRSCETLTKSVLLSRMTRAVCWNKRIKVEGGFSDSRESPSLSRI